MTQRILVWDIPTRVFHWLLVVSFAGAFWSGDSERYRDIHVVLGFTLLGLIAFRLVWGFVGTRYAQFRSFLFSPAETARYLASLVKGNPVHYVGHNPAGSLAVFALLALGIASGATGYMLFQDIGGEAVEELHEVVSYAMLAVVGLHVAGVLVSSVMHRENLVRSMITGFKSAEPSEGINRAYAWLGAILLALVVAFWVGYPATGLVSPAAQAGQHGDDDD
ncbi:MAG TPA: cytochrome b/b6 domain-containing protein [Gallionella sp.]|nr:cytochrome b/b6 domain-containing protein [Gallionella sp.]